MKLCKLLSEDCKYFSKGAVGIWLSILFIIIITLFYILKFIDINAYKATSATWLTILGNADPDISVNKATSRIAKRDDSNIGE